MALTRSQVDAALQEIYDEIPAMDGCDGRCWTSCLGGIEMTDREHQRIRQAGIRITPMDQAVSQDEPYQCEALTGGRRCAVYALRPLICRLWGVMRSLPCLYGCRPAGSRYLSDEEAYAMIFRAAEVAGHSILRPGETAQQAMETFTVMLRSRAGRQYMARHTRLDEKAARRAVPPAFRKPVP